MINASSVLDSIEGMSGLVAIIIATVTLLAVYRQIAIASKQLDQAERQLAKADEQIILATQQMSLAREELQVVRDDVALSRQVVDDMKRKINLSVFIWFDTPLRESLEEEHVIHMNTAIHAVNIGARTARGFNLIVGIPPSHKLLVEKLPRQTFTEFFGSALTPEFVGYVFTRFTFPDVTLYPGDRMLVATLPLHAQGVTKPLVVCQLAHDDGLQPEADGLFYVAREDERVGQPVRVVAEAKL